MPGELSPAGVLECAADERGRVRQAAGSRTAPALLAALARDPSLTVRAAVALNPAVSEEVERLLAGDDDERVRALLARRIAGLAPTLPVREQELLANRTWQVLAALVHDESKRVRAAIAEAVKEMADVPRALILQLAADTEIEIAEPVVRLSPVLTEADLMGLLAGSPAQATAVAVARRPGLSGRVSDAVVASANSAAIRALLANPAAAIRETTLDSLIARAAEHLDWQEPLVRRPQLSPRAARALAGIVADQFLGLLAARSDLAPDTLAEIRRRLGPRLAGEAGHARLSAAVSAEQAMAEAEAMEREGQLDEATLLRALNRGEVERASAMLAVAAGVPLAVVEQAAVLRSAKGLVALVWKSGFSMRVASPVQTLLARLAPDTILLPAAAGNFPLTAEEMRWQLDFLLRSR